MILRERLWRKQQKKENKASEMNVVKSAKFPDLIQAVAETQIILQSENDTSYKSNLVLNHSLEEGTTSKSESKTLQQPSKQHNFPRVVHLTSQSSASSSRFNMTSPKFENAELGRHKDPPTESEMLSKINYDQSCVGQTWHSINPVNCNTFHEIDIGMTAKGREAGDYIRFLGQGGRRDTWMLDRSKGTRDQTYSQQAEKLALKTLLWDESLPYSERLYEHQRYDALALERFTYSPHIIDVFGFCGMSTINEFASNGNIFDFIQTYGGAIETKDLLVYARNISMGLADVQELDVNNLEVSDNPGNTNLNQPPVIPSLLHNDFRHHNILLTEEYKVKISDFNRAQLLRLNSTSKQICNLVWTGVACGKYVWGSERAPEECKAKGSEPIPDPSKTEVYHLGIVLHFILSRKKYPFVSSEHWMGGVGLFTLEGNTTTYNHTEVSKKIQGLILKGELPPLPTEVIDSQDPAINAIVRARNKALVYNPTTRSNARDIANFLEKVVVELNLPPL